MSKRTCLVCQNDIDDDRKTFCSERCRLIDLSGWLGERYRIPDRSDFNDLNDDDNWVQ